VTDFGRAVQESVRRVHTQLWPGHPLGWGILGGDNQGRPYTGPRETARRASVSSWRGPAQGGPAWGPGGVVSPFGFSETLLTLSSLVARAVICSWAKLLFPRQSNLDLEKLIWIWTLVCNNCTLIQYFCLWSIVISGTHFRVSACCFDRKYMV